MDPLSITTTASFVISSLHKLLETLYVFAKDAKNVNRTLKRLSYDVDSLVAILKSIQHVLGSSSTHTTLQTEKGNEILYSAIGASLKGCEDTANSLCKVLISVQREDGDATTFVARAFLQLKLVRRREDIQGAMSRLENHKGNLQLSLQSLTVYV